MVLLLIASAGVADGLEGVQVLDLRNRRVPELAVLPDVQVDVGIAPHVAFLKVSVCHLDVAEDFLHCLHKEGCFLRAGHVGFG